MLEFCDDLWLLDHGSGDKTWKILSELTRQYNHVHLYKIESADESHSYIKSLAGTNSWVFGVDGDEIYDASGLRRVKQKIYEGLYDEWWQLFGNVLNCTQINYEQETALGYLAPPCRSITKLFNFNAIEKWGGACPERLHGGEVRFRAGYNHKKRLNLHVDLCWELADLRCLHACFLPRSSLDGRSANARLNIVEKNTINASSFLRRLIRAISLRPEQGIYKKKKYMRGELVKKNIGMFFNTQRGAVEGFGRKDDLD